MILTMTFRILKKGKGAAAAASKSKQPTEDWRLKYGFKQPAPGIKSKSALAGGAVSLAPATKGTKAGGWAEESRGGVGAECGLDAMLAALESEVLMLEGREDDALIVLGRAIECEGAKGRDTVLGGELLWVQADLRLRLGEGLLARAERTSDSLSDGIEFSKVHSIVTSYSKYSRALTFQNLCQASKTKCSRASASSFSNSSIFLPPKAPPAKMRQPPRRKVKTMLRKLRMRQLPVPVPRLFPVRRS
jgi:hypothetical protein